MPRPKLVTIPISHYGERARWALDHAGIDYDEEHHLQMFSWLAAYRNGRRKFLPVLVAGGEVLNDSGLILRWASARAEESLFPPDPREEAEVERLSQSLAGAFGVAARLVAYEWFFRIPDLAFTHNAGRAPRYQTGLVDRMHRPITAFAKWYLGVRPEPVNAAVERVDQVFDDIAARLSDGRPYLFGDAFGAADLTFAAMSAPCTLTDRYPVPLPDPERLPEDARRRVERWREHPAGKFALRLYDERPKPRGTYTRPLRVEPCSPASPSATGSLRGRSGASRD